MENLVYKVKLSKKYRHVTDSVVEAELEDYKRKNPNWKEYREGLIIRDIRAKLHRIHGSFRLSDKNDKKLKQSLEKKDFLSILKQNRSTRERIDIYPELYEKIFEITGNPSIIVDLGAGLNPVSIPLMNLNKSLVYYSYDINEKENDFLNEFFKKLEINGKSSLLDLTNVENIKALPESDLCFMFKLVDVLEANKKGHKYSEEIIKILADKCKFVVVSFSKLTVSGKKMNFPYRGWIERMLERIGLKFKQLDFDNEVFYVVSK